MKPVERVRDWWRGRSVTTVSGDRYENRVVVMGVERHWSERLARRAWALVRKHGPVIVAAIIGALASKWLS